MNCTSCGAETNGIKLNGKNYCPFCGEAITQVTPDEALSEIAGPPKAKIFKEEVVTEIDVLKAEEQVLDLLKDNSVVPKEEPSAEPAPKIPDSSLEITKNNRTRIGHKSTQQELPDNDPVVTGVTQEQTIKESKAETVTDVSYPLFDKGELQDIQKKREQKKEALNNYLKSKAKTASTTKSKKPKRKKKSKVKWLIVVLVILIFFGAGLTAYVNLFVMNPGKSKEVVTASMPFTLKEPSYIPFGYKFAYLEKINDQRAAYHYIFIGDPGKKIVIFEGEGAQKDPYNENVKNIPGIYTEFEQNNIKFWYINDKILVFKDNLIYQIESSATMTKEELLKIAEGLIENNYISG